MSYGVTDPMQGNVRIVFEGDSNMAGVGNNLEGPRLAVANLLSEDIAAGRLPRSMTFQYIGPLTNGSAPTTKHMGESGSTIDNHADASGNGTNNTTNYAWFYYGQTETVFSRTNTPLYNAEIVVLMIGTNNTANGTVLANGIAKYEGLLETIGSRIATKLQYTRVVAVKIPPRAVSFNSNVADMNAAIVTARDTARGNGYQITDADASGCGIVVNTSGPGDFLQYDGSTNDQLHLGPTGQAKLAIELHRAIREALGYPM